jgi:N-ethylmaleimide reductase
MRNDAASSVLLSPFDMRGLLLKNRVAMSPLTRSRAGQERLANALMAEYYDQRASSALIISEATVISNQAIGWLNSPGIYSDEQAESWRQVVKAVHDRGTPIFLQLWHCGRASHTSFHVEEGLPVAPSAIRLEGDHIHTPIGKVPHEMPRALETGEVPAIVEDYRRAAELAKRAGFDGVEIHAANGYLIDQFLQS